MTNLSNSPATSNKNPLVLVRTDEFGEPERVYELKFGLVFYLDYPPGPKRAAAVLDLYLKRYGSRIRRYLPTTPGSLPLDWTPDNLQLVRNKLLPALRQSVYWGYGFDDNQILDSYLFMFHGFRPHRDEGVASFFRFEFPWDIDQHEVRDFAVDVAELVPFDSGSCGFFLQVKNGIPEGYDAMFAICRRYWGVEAWNLDVTVKHVLHAYKTVNWLTMIGNQVANLAPDAIAKARQVATYCKDTVHGTVLQATEQALLGDRHRREDMSGYAAVAQALRPLQVNIHGSFGGERWDEASSLAWLRRFTDQNHP